MDFIGDNKTHVARKKHRCLLCGGIIEPGERYVTTFNVDGGYAFNFDRHVLCDETMDNIKDEPDDGWTEEYFSEEMYSELYEMLKRVAKDNNITDSDEFIENLLPESFESKCVMFNTLSEFERIRKEKF